MCLKPTWGHNIKTYSREIACEVVEWGPLARNGKKQQSYLEGYWELLCHGHVQFLDQVTEYRLCNMETALITSSNKTRIVIIDIWLSYTDIFVQLYTTNSCLQKYSQGDTRQHFCHQYVECAVIKTRRMRWPGHVARMGEGIGVYRVLVWKPEGRRLLGRPRRRWEDNIRMDLREVGCGCVDWMELAQNRDRWRALVSAVMNLRVP